MAKREPRPLLDSAGSSNEEAPKVAREERTIRFVVGSAAGQRSSTWRCWTPAGGKSDVYLAPRSVGGSFKVSLHESGSWQTGLTSELKRELETEGRWKGGSRLTSQFSRPTEMAPGCVLAFRILVPVSAVSIDGARENLPKDLVWIPPPPADRAIEIALIITATGVKVDGWPGRRSMSTGLVGGFPLDSGDHLWLVHREVPIPVIPPARGGISRFEPSAEFSQRLEDARVLVGIDIDGQPAAIMECRIEDRRFEDSAGG